MNTSPAIVIETEKPPVVELDSQANAAYVRFSRHKVATTRPLHLKGCIITADFDARNALIGIELVGVKEFGIKPLMKKAGVSLPEGLAQRARYVSAKLQEA